MAGNYSHFCYFTVFRTVSLPNYEVDGTADYLFFYSTTAFTTVCTLYCSVDGGGLLVLPLVNGFHDSTHAVLISGWQQFAHTSAHQHISAWFVCHITLQMVADGSFFRSSMAFITVYLLCFSADGSG